MLQDGQAAHGADGAVFRYQLQQRDTGVGAWLCSPRVLPAAARNQVQQVRIFL